jgi:hypothetical protein
MTEVYNEQEKVIDNKDEYEYKQENIEATPKRRLVIGSKLIKAS